MDDFGRIKELSQNGYYCSQILVQMGLDLQGKSNPDLIRSMQALAGGIGFNGLLCGALSGGACLLSLYAGTVNRTDENKEVLDLMLIDLVNWFKSEIGSKYNGIDCDAILEGQRMNIPLRCPGLVQGVFQKVKEILVEYGFDLTGTPTNR